ncbi:MAG: hypothetical protein PHX40_01370 [Bacilli bacterium]|nr:hypothetical protein [Bacilli bacterium]MDD4831497.1 hypothetical protein [Bacilli bacterium]
MNIVIAHLYYDILNLYGESGNIDVLEYHLKDNNIKYTIKKLTLEDKLNFDEYDLVYMGSGTENNQKYALNHLKQYKEDIKKNIDNNKLFLITGNSIELFGKDALNIFEFTSEKQDKRTVLEINTKIDQFDSNILGFINQQTKLNKDTEFIINKNFIGTHLLGPILARNPEVLKYLFNKLTIIKKLNLSLDEKAYKEYINFKENVK